MCALIDKIQISNKKTLTHIQQTQTQHCLLSKWMSQGSGLHIALFLFYHSLQSALGPRLLDNKMEMSILGFISACACMLVECRHSQTQNTSIQSIWYCTLIFPVSLGNCSLICHQQAKPITSMFCSKPIILFHLHQLAYQLNFPDTDKTDIEFAAGEYIIVQKP